MDRMDILRCTVGFPLVVSSGYRCPSYNASISKTGTRGPHTTGRAIDLLVTSEDALTVVGEAYNLGFTGIGVSQKGDHKKRFIHLDDLSSPEFPRPTIFSY
jgi:zinc D-Ala-D-Ala carboxypeptidase